jgi:hypothetical protein
MLTLLVVLFVIVGGIDCLQTIKILGSDRFKELNSIIRWVYKIFDATGVVAYFIAFLIVVLLISFLVSFGNEFVAFVVGFEAALVSRNYMIGVRIK